MNELRRPSRAMTAAEARLWHLTVKDVVPLGEPAPPPEDEAGEPPPAPVPARAVVPPSAPSPPPPAAVLGHGHTAGIDHRTAERLRRGHLAIEATIDLHGMTQARAHAALHGFIARSQSAGRRCVLVITGKGGREGTGVLRGNVPRWLNEPELRGRVLCFSYARPRDGGEGALYILLKRVR